MRIALIAVIASSLVCHVFSITCYQCVPEMTANCSSFNTKQCIHHQIKRTCPKGMDSCMRTHVSGILTGATIDVEKRSCASTSTCGSLKTSCDRLRMNFTDVKCDWSCCRSDLCNVGHDVGYSPILLLVVAFLTVFL